MNRSIEDLMEMQRPYVEKGAAFFDENYEGWWRKILDHQMPLQMQTTNFCVCGMVFGTYKGRPEELLEEPELFGLTINPEVANRIAVDDSRNAALWRALDRLWIEEIAWRKEAAGL